MAEHNTAPATPASVPALDPQLMEILKLLAGNAAREAAKGEIEAAQQKARDLQRTANAKEKSQDRLIKQARCTHLKGTGKGPKSPQIDYAVGYHLFINEEQRITCLVCGMKWRQGDTVEFLVRNGRKIPNHTKKGWNEALGMTAQSTNKASRSEVPTGKPTGIGVGSAGQTISTDQGYEAQ